MCLIPLRQPGRSPSIARAKSAPYLVLGSPALINSDHRFLCISCNNGEPCLPDLIDGGEVYFRTISRVADGLSLTNTGPQHPPKRHTETGAFQI